MACITGSCTNFAIVIIALLFCVKLGVAEGEPPLAIDFSLAAEICDQYRAFARTGKVQPKLEQNSKISLFAPCGWMVQQDCGEDQDCKPFVFKSCSEKHEETTTPKPEIRPKPGRNAFKRSRNPRRYPHYPSFSGEEFTERIGPRYKYRKRPKYPRRNSTRAKGKAAFYGKKNKAAGRSSSRRSKFRNSWLKPTYDRPRSRLRNRIGAKPKPVILHKNVYSNFTKIYSEKKSMSGYEYVDSQESSSLERTTRRPKTKLKNAFLKPDPAEDSGTIILPDRQKSSRNGKIHGKGSARSHKFDYVSEEEFTAPTYPHDDTLKSFSIPIQSNSEEDEYFRNVKVEDMVEAPLVTTTQATTTVSTTTASSTSALPTTFTTTMTTTTETPTTTATSPPTKPETTATTTTTSISFNTQGITSETTSSSTSSSSSTSGTTTMTTTTATSSTTTTTASTTTNTTAAQLAFSTMRTRLPRRRYRYTTTTTPVVTTTTTTTSEPPMPKKPALMYLSEGLSKAMCTQLKTFYQTEKIQRSLKDYSNVKVSNNGSVICAYQKNQCEASETDCPSWSKIGCDQMDQLRDSYKLKQGFAS